LKNRNQVRIPAIRGRQDVKILAVIGSPRGKGNTYRVVKAVEEKMKSLGGVTFDYLLLKDADLRPCRGCYVCLAKGENKCPLADGRADIERRMLAADGVIFACPVFGLNVPWIMANFIDRFAYSMHRPRFFNQFALLVVTTGFSGRKETLGTLSALKWTGFSIVGSVAAVMEPAGLRKRTWEAAKKKAERAAAKFYRAVEKQRHPAPSLGRVIGFRAQQVSFSLNVKAAPADYKYFEEHGWFEGGRKFYTDAWINPLKDGIARLTAVWVRPAIRRELADELAGDE